MPAKFVIHTVGPIWYDGYRCEPELLASCYTNSLKLAVENGVRKIAFPSISTGVYGYPVNLAAEVAVKTVKEFLKNNPDSMDEIIWACFDDRTLAAYEGEIDK